MAGSHPYPGGSRGQPAILIRINTIISFYIKKCTIINIGWSALVIGLYL